MGTSGHEGRAEGDGPATSIGTGIESDLDLNRPHAARIYDYFLGGKTNYAADRGAAAKVLQAYPDVMVAARYNRAFMHRATRFVSERHGIRQFLDIGTGIPTEPNLHQVAQRDARESRVVYADNDRIVLAYARALLDSSGEGSTDYVHADVREPGKILQEAHRTLDFSRPISLSLVALAHFLVDEDDPYELVRTLMEPMPSGSALCLSHATEDFDPEVMRKTRDTYIEQGINVALRERGAVARFFERAGLELVEPGLTPTCDWRPELEPGGVPTLPGMVTAGEVGLWAGVGIKP
jgi:hypothetical protein